MEKDEQRINFRAVMLRLISDVDVCWLKSRGLHRLAHKKRRQNRKLYKEYLDLYKERVAVRMDIFLDSPQTMDTPAIQLAIQIRKCILSLELAHLGHLLHMGDVKKVVRDSMDEIDELLGLRTGIVAIRPN